MTIPNFLSNSYAPFRYYSSGATGYTDPLNVIPIIRAELTALGWTEPVANTFQCPSDTAGHWMRLAFSKYGTSFLNMLVTDQNGTTIAHRSSYFWTTPGSPFTLYTGKFHFLIEPAYPQSTGGWSYTAAFLLDTTPDPPASCPSPVAAAGTYDSAGGSDGYGLLNYWFAKDNAGVAVTTRLRGSVTFGGTAYGLTMASGRAIYDECLIYQLIGGTGVGNYPFTGRFCQALLGPGEPLIVGLDRRIPIDDGTVAVFRSTSVIPSGSTYWRLYMRKS